MLFFLTRVIIIFEIKRLQLIFMTCFLLFERTIIFIRAFDLTIIAYNEGLVFLKFLFDKSLGYRVKIRFGTTVNLISSMSKVPIAHLTQTSNHLGSARYAVIDMPLLALKICLFNGH